MHRRKILATTACRSDYDLLSSVYKKLNKDNRFNFQILVSGTHLLKKYGLTINHIISDEISIIGQIETISNKDDLNRRPMSIAKLLMDGIRIIQNFKPDLLLSVGDREDALATCIMGIYLKVPVCHFFGGDYGETRDVDGHIRHACSKLSMAHFVISKEHEDRLLSIGENKDRIYNVGHPHLDNYVSTSRMEIEEIFSELSCTKNIKEPYCILIYHPSYVSMEITEKEIKTIIEVIKQENQLCFVGIPNIDFGSDVIIKLFKKLENDNQFIFYKSIRRDLFINLVRNAEFLIGNSSMGILESSIIPLPVINVGERQRGRHTSENVIFVDSNVHEIKEAINQIRSIEFVNKINSMKNIYGNGKSTEKIIDILNDIDLDSIKYKNEDPLTFYKRFNGQK